MDDQLPVVTYERIGRERDRARQVGLGLCALSATIVVIAIDMFIGFVRSFR